MYVYAYVYVCMCVYIYIYICIACISPSAPSAAARTFADEFDRTPLLCYNII